MRNSSSPSRRLKLAAAALLGALVLLPTAPAPAATLAPPVWATQPEGFGAATTGGAAGPVAWVTTTADSGPGSLRSFAEAPGALRIGFRVSGTITLASNVLVGADKTIDGRGAAITITGRGFVLRQPNVIIRDLSLRDIAPRDDQQDAILIDGAHDVWIDHNTMTNAGDKLIGIPEGTDITISWNRMHHQEQVLQIGTFSTARESKDTRVTVHHNFFDENGYRNPRVSYGVVHAYSNWLRHWRTHGMSGVRGSQLLSQSNIFEAGSDRDAVISIGGDTDKDRSPGFVRSDGDLLLNGARVRQNEPALALPAPPTAPSLEAAGLPLAIRLGAFAGWNLAPPPF